MGFIKTIAIILITIGLGAFYYLEKHSNDQLRNQLVFEYPTSQVSDSLRQMENLMNKFPETGMINYFVDGDGNLYLNNQRIAPLKGAINNKIVREDFVFEGFTEAEINNFFNLMAYLWENHITSCYKEPIIQMFAFSYREDQFQRSNYSEMIIIPKNASDTTSYEFKNYFEILDEKDGLILIR